MSFAIFNPTESQQKITYYLNFKIRWITEHNILTEDQDHLKNIKLQN